VSFSADVLAHSPAAYWRLDESSGTTAADSSGNSRTLSATTAPTWGDAASGGVLVDGTSASGFTANTRLVTSAGVLGALTAFTFMAAFKTTGSTTAMLIARDQSTGSADRHFQFRLSAAGNVELITFNTSNAAATIASASTYRDGAWHLAFGVWTGTELRLYVDGVSVATAVSTSVVRTGTTALIVGSRYQGTGGSWVDSWAGGLDEVAIWTTALSAGDIADLHDVWSAVAVTGTGAATGPAGIASGSGVVTTVGIGAATGPAGIASGSGTVTTIGTGAATGPAGVASGLGTVDGTIFGTGAATGPAGVASGVGVVTTIGTGAAVGPAGVAAGAGVVTTIGVGAAAGPAGVAAGSGDNSGFAPPSLTMSAGLTLTLAGGVYRPGSLYNAILLSTSPEAVDFTDFASSPVPEPEDGDLAAVDAWYRYESLGSDTVTLTWTGVSVGLEVWIISFDDVFTDIDEATLVGSGVGPTLAFSAGEDQAYLIRVHPMDDADNAASGSLAWATVARPASGALNLEAGEIVYDTPAWLTASILSATPDGEVQFEIDTVLVLTTTADDAGTIPTLAIPAGVLLTVGTHTLLARDVTTGVEDSVEFEVESLTMEPDADPPSVGPATPATGGVIQWIFELPDPGGMTFTFPHNPTEMTSPFSRRVLNPEFTAAPDGQPIIFEGEPVATEWGATGVVFTQAHYEALEAWHVLNRRFYAIDHHERAWLVTLEDVSWSAKRDPSRPWAHGYSLKFLIWGGPYELEEVP
jgi:hypothetical protein